MCIGHRLAPIEAVELLKPILDRFQIKPTAPLQMKAHITLFPTGPVLLQLQALQ